MISKNNYLQVISVFALFFMYVNIGVGQNITILPNGISPAQTGGIPKYTYEQIIDLPNPQNGDLVNDVTFNCLKRFDGQKWQVMYFSDDPSITLFFLNQSNQARVYDLISDSQSNIYATGTFAGTLQFGSFSITGYGNSEGFIGKFNSAGTCIWLKRIGGTSTSTAKAICKHIGLDSQNNIYVTGEGKGIGIFGTINLDMGTLNVGSGFGSIFTTKLNNNGTFIWAIRNNSSGNHYGYANNANKALTDNTGNTYITGTYEVGNEYGSNTFPVSGGVDIFLYKVNTSGTILWAKRIYGNGGDWANDMAIDNSGNLYIVGETGSTSSFNIGSTTVNISTSSFDKVFVVKLDNNGNSIWSKFFLSNNVFFRCNHISVINTEIFISGQMAANSSVSFGSNSLSSSSIDRYYLVKFDNNGNSINARFSSLFFNVKTIVQTNGKLKILTENSLGIINSNLFVEYSYSLNGNTALSGCLAPNSNFYFGGFLYSYGASKIGSHYIAPSLIPDRFMLGRVVF